jgi:hypothetical protein
MSTSSYATASYTLPPSSVYNSPLTTNTNAGNGYNPAAGGQGTNGGEAGGSNAQSSNAGFVAVDQNGNMCYPTSTTIITQQATVTVTPFPAGETLQSSAVTFNTHQYNMPPSAVYGLPAPVSAAYSSMPAMKREAEGAYEPAH